MWRKAKECSKQKEKASMRPLRWAWSRVEGDEANKGQITEAKVRNLGLSEV